ncbi:MAG: phosphopantetheine-binding protein [Hungatella sp.]|jgi:acyl carrier protein|nr:phosphopantetheine-binding protein [Hungatella sp.]
MTVTEKEEILQYALKRKEICLKLKEMVVEKLYLEMEPEFITDDQPLFGRGLELDSIDSLELAVGIYDTFQNKLPDGDANVFSSINSMADYIINCLPEDEDMKRDITGFVDLDA